MVFFLTKNPSESEKRSDEFFVNLSQILSHCFKSIKNALPQTRKGAYLLVIPGRFELPTYRLGVLIMLKLSLLYVIFLRFVQKFTVQSVYFVNFFRMFSIHSIRISPFFVLRFLYYFLYVHCV